MGGNMGIHPAARREAGFTFAELAFGFLVFVILAVVLINHLTVNFKTTMSERERVFAFSKAQAILAEIQSLVDRGAAGANVDLDGLDDGVVNKPTLTITTVPNTNVLVEPDHVLSGNIIRNDEWLWSRRITTQPFQGLNNRNVRYVTVVIYKRNDNGVDEPVASLSSVVNNPGDAYRPRRSSTCT
jgi:Tfp pilus assembly protein PilX